jgi:transcriptional regulator with XRE-family HTH domain
MCTLYENIKSICDNKGVTGGKMCSDLGISRSILTGLKNGTKKTISADTAQKFADYLGVSVDRVLGVENEKSSTPEGMELSKTQSVALDLIMNMSEDQLKKFIQLAEIALEIPPTK